MHDGIQHGAVALALLAVAEDAPAEGGAVEWVAGWGWVGEQEVGRRAAEGVYDLGVCFRAGLDDLAGYDVCIDDGEVVGRGAEEVRDC